MTPGSEPFGDVEIVAINLSERLACDDQGNMVPVARLFDRYGDETDVPTSATRASVGPDREGMWWLLAVNEGGIRRQ